MAPALDWQRFSTCRVEDCAGTSREFKDLSYLGTITADDERIYWVESFTAADGLLTSEIFSVRRLPRLSNGPDSE